MKKIYTDKAPRVVGPYSQAVISKGFVFCSGQIGLDPKTGELIGYGIVKQTTQAIKNLKTVLEESGSTLEKVVKTTCYLTDMDDYQKFNEVYASYFTENPARSTVEVSKLPKDALVEIEVVAEIVL